MLKNKYNTMRPSSSRQGFVWILFLSVSFTIFNSCEKFWEPEMGLIIEKEDYFTDWSEYRSAEMGLYSLQQKLVDQIVVLGELRADLLEITPNADKDLKEVYNFQISNTNKYASPEGFYRLIGACNSLITQLKTAHPEVLDKRIIATSFDRLYGEALCMRAWAYFNAVRIYGKVPYVWESMTTVEEITNYVNSSTTIIDTVHIIFDPGGYYNDTLRNDTILLERHFLDTRAVIDTFTTQLLNEVKAVGVLHNTYNLDATWDVTIWNKYAWRTLLGQMFLYQGDLTAAYEQFSHILYNYDSETSNVRFGLDQRFRNNNWRSIFTGIDGYEHIYTLWFGKAYQQQNNLQAFFSLVPPNTYQMKPTSLAVENWECIWDSMEYDLNASNPALTTLEEVGAPGDFYRGYGVSYAYLKDGVMMEKQDVRDMLKLRRDGYVKDYEEMIYGVDTVVYKYTIGKTSFDHDANFNIFRAAGVHLYAAEIFIRWEFDHQGLVRTEELTGLAILNNGSYQGNPNQLGVRGRVGFGDGDDAVRLANYIYKHDPYTNEIVGWYNYTNNFPAKQDYLEDMIIQERARELAYEGERFYDLMRIAKRRGDPSYLADKVASKFSGSRAEEIRQFLMDENNWYIPYYE